MWVRVTLQGGNQCVLGVVHFAWRSILEHLCQLLLVRTLQNNTVKLHTYTGELIKVCGSTLVSIEHNGQTATLPLIVTAGSGPTVLVRDWLAAQQLDWKIFTVTPTLTLQQVLNEHIAVFKESLGELHAAQIHIDGNVQPIFHKARQVPSAIRKKVEAPTDTWCHPTDTIV